MIEGICRICGTKGKLSFEHVPPKAAFNNRRSVRVSFETALALGPDEPVKGPIQQGGIGYHSLCPKCNNLTGKWYGKYFVDWCYQGMKILIRARGKPTLIYMHYIFPLAILKQIVAMFFSINPPGFSAVHSELADFVLNKEKKYLPPKYRFFVYFNTTGKFRTAGSAGILRMSSDFQSCDKPILISEIGYSPFGYVMTIDSEPPDRRLFEITHFSRYGYNEFKVMELSLPILPTHLIYPGDYRTKEEIAEQAAHNRSLMKQSGIQATSPRFKKKRS